MRSTLQPSVGAAAPKTRNWTKWWRGLALVRVTAMEPLIVQRSLLTWWTILDIIYTAQWQNKKQYKRSFLLVAMTMYNDTLRWLLETLLFPIRINKVFFCLIALFCCFEYNKPSLPHVLHLSLFEICHGVVQRILGLMQEHFRILILNFSHKFHKKVSYEHVTSDSTNALNFWKKCVNDLLKWWMPPVRIRGHVHEDIKFAYSIP